jgi:hypothetical protein
LAPRTSATFAKRQKERARQEKQQVKQERRLQRKQEKLESPRLFESGEFDGSSEAPFDSAPLTDTTMVDSATAPAEKELQ